VKFLLFEYLKIIISINVFKVSGRVVYILKDFTNICRLIWKNKKDFEAFYYYLLGTKIYV